MLTVIDEFTLQCLAIEVSRRVRSDDDLRARAGLLVGDGALDHIRSDNSYEFNANAVRAWRVEPTLRRGKISTPDTDLRITLME